ncbi:hypothetical protein ADA01nite_42280 [Aneurinibacillus danicus]|uniref:Uncharacterized protein n=1 Tax=Aneurinibacillus danicus TaxID=267746 RepID=A0A511VFM8_9BACL|nr:hypothetical protein ADA01nite_42280 [Aneurinibacillus danicus]
MRDFFVKLRDNFLPNIAASKISVMAILVLSFLCRIFFKVISMFEKEKTK